MPIRRMLALLGHDILAGNRFERPIVNQEIFAFYGNALATLLIRTDSDLSRITGDRPSATRGQRQNPGLIWRGRAHGDGLSKLVKWPLERIGHPALDRLEL